MIDSLKSIKQRTLYTFFIGYFAVVLGTVIFPPVFKIFNRIEPWILGLPFLQFWLIVVSILTSLGLFVLFEIEELRGEI